MAMKAAQVKEWYLKNKTHVQSYKKAWRAKNKEKLQRGGRAYYLENKARINKRRDTWMANNKAHIAAYKLQWEKDQLSSNPLFKIKKRLRTRVRHALAGRVKSAKTIELIGCEIDFLKNHLETQFKLGMSWDNYGEWHVDHIRPCSSFNLANPEEQLACFNYRNMQPLWAIDNLRKGDNYVQ